VDSGLHSPRLHMTIQASSTKVTVEPFTEDHSCCPLNIGRGPLDEVIHQI